MVLLPGPVETPFGPRDCPQSPAIVTRSRQSTPTWPFDPLSAVATVSPGGIERAIVPANPGDASTAASTGPNSVRNANGEAREWSRPGRSGWSMPSLHRLQPVCRPLTPTSLIALMPRSPERTNRRSRACGTNRRTCGRIPWHSNPTREAGVNQNRPARPQELIRETTRADCETRRRYEQRAPSKTPVASRAIASRRTPLWGLRRDVCSRLRWLATPSTSPKPHDGDRV